MKNLAAESGRLVVFLITGALWVVLVRLMPDGGPRNAIVVALGVVFAAIFMWVLMRHVRAVLGGTRHLVWHTVVATVELALFLVAFAAVYQTLGLQDNTRPDMPTVHAFGTSFYYSVVTFTTLGYGDFYPVGSGRALASAQALTGYLILGLLASTAASALSPHSKAGWNDEESGRSA